jgi:hypothetical protein
MGTAGAPEALCVVFIGHNRAKFLIWLSFLVMRESTGLVRAACANRS